MLWNWILQTVLCQILIIGYYLIEIVKTLILKLQKKTVVNTLLKEYRRPLNELHLVNPISHGVVWVWGIITKHFYFGLK